jgi:hypothetical protein
MLFRDSRIQTAFADRTRDRLRHATGDIYRITRIMGKNGQDYKCRVRNKIATSGDITFVLLNRFLTPAQAS